MPNPTVSIGFSPTIPAPDSGYQNAIPRGDGGAPLLRESFEVPSTGGVSVKTASYTATAADCGKILSFADSSPATGHTLTLPATPPFAQWRISVQNTGSAVLTINRNGKLIDGGTTGPTLAHDSGMDIATDGTNYFTERGVAGTGGGGGGSSMTFTGAWSLGTAYAVGDVASYNGSLYLRLVAGGSVGTPTVVQSAALMHTGGVAFPSNVSAGNLLVVAVSQETTAPPAPTDTLGTVYTLVKSQTGVNNISIYAGIAPSSGANTVTSPNVSFSGTSISEISNVSATVNATSSAYFNATPASAPITTTAAGCLIYAAIAGNHNANTFTALTGFTLTAQANGSDAIAGETGFASTPGTYTPGFNETDGIPFNDTDMAIAAVAFTSAAITPDFDAANWDVFWEGVPGAATATSGTLGIVKPDNSTITISGGVISAVGGGGGSVVLLEAHTASSSAALNFTASFSSSYDEYIIKGVGLIPATNATNLIMEFSTDGGSTYDTGSNYSWAYTYLSQGGSSSTVAGNPDSAIHLSNANSNSSGFSVSFSMDVFNPLSTTLRCKLTFDLVQDNSGDSNTYRYTGLARYKVSTGVNAFRIRSSSGNITSGVVRCYGVAH
jgi:hypothetical protein